MAAAIEFKLFAANNKAATLLASFSVWEEIALEKDERGYFRTKIQLEDRPLLWLEWSYLSQLAHRSKNPRAWLSGSVKT